MQGQPDLFEVFGATRPIGSFAHLLSGRLQRPNQDGDDGHCHQQLDQREVAA
jgi:hypothetical protein